MARTQNIADLNVRLNLELNRLDAQINQANAKIKTLTRRMNSDFQSAARGITKSLNAIGVGLSVGAITAFSKTVIDLGSDITDLSRAANVNTQVFQDLSNLASLSGVSMEQVSKALVDVQRNVQEAVEGNKSLIGSFERIGLSADYLKTLAPEKQFEEVAKAVANATDKSAAFNAALDIIGSKNAPKLAEVLDTLGKKGLSGVAEELGKLRLSQEQLDTLDKAGDKLDYIWTRIKLIGAAAVVGVSNYFDNDKQYGDLNPDTEAGRKAIQKKAADERFLARSRQLKAEREAAKLGDQSSDRSDRAAELEFQAQQRKKAFDDAVKLQSERDDRLQKNIEQSMAENSSMLADQFSRERDQYGAQYDALWKAQTAAKAREVQTEIEINESIAAIQKEYDEKQLEEYGKLAEAEFKIADDGNKKKEESLKNWAEVNSQMWENIADRTSAALSDMLIDGQAKFKDFAAGIARMIADVALRLAIINPIINSTFGLKGTSALPSIMGARAMGGPMSAGGTYLAGEFGPELVTPTANSMVTPNHALAAMGGGGGTTINIDASNSQIGVIEEIKAGLSYLNATFNVRAVGAVSEARRRGGGIGRSLGA